MEGARVDPPVSRSTQRVGGVGGYGAAWLFGGAKPSSAPTSRSWRVPGKWTLTPGRPGLPRSHPAEERLAAAARAPALAACTPSVNVRLGELAPGEPRRTPPPVFTVQAHPAREPARP